MKRFTLIELLVVVAIIGILLSILLPSLHRAREKAKDALCLSNLKQSYTLALSYSTDNDENFPPVDPTHEFLYNTFTDETLTLDSYGNLEVWKCAVLPNLPSISDTGNTRTIPRSTYFYLPGRTTPYKQTPTSALTMNSEHLFMQDIWYTYGSNIRTNHSQGGKFKVAFSDNPSFGTFFDGSNMRTCNASWGDGHAKTYKSGTVIGITASVIYGPEPD